MLPSERLKKKEECREKNKTKGVMLKRKEIASHRVDAERVLKRDPLEISTNKKKPSKKQEVQL